MILVGVRDFNFPVASTSVPGPTQPPAQRVTAASSLCSKAVGHEADHSRLMPMLVHIAMLHQPDILSWLGAYFQRTQIQQAGGVSLK